MRRTLLFWVLTAPPLAFLTLEAAASPPRSAESAFAFGIAYDASAGESLYASRCAGCHDHPSGRTPAKSVIANNTPAYIFGALTDGIMRANAEGIAYADKLAIAMYVSENKSGGAASGASFETPKCTSSPPALNLSAPGWNGWGRTPENTRFQSKPGFEAAQVSRLKLKWAMAVSGNRNGEPVIAGSWLFTNDTAGSVYGLDANTGCAYWRYNAEGPTRSTISLISLPGEPDKIAAFFTDAAGYLYALDAGQGTLLWRTKIDEQRSHQFTGSVTAYQGVIYAPVASGEEAYAMDDSYPCCKFRGALVAVSADTGKILWTTYTTSHEAKPFKKNRAGNWMYGPGGGAIWSAPTIDATRGLAYITTGDSYTDVPHEGTDAVIAIDLKTGKIVWLRQLTRQDSYIIGCTAAAEKRPANCPEVLGADNDFGAAATLARGPDGKQIILVSQKSSEVYALDPNSRGQVIWQKRLSQGGPLGGSEWGHAIDEQNIYVGISDVYVHQGAAPQLTALRIRDGSPVWRQSLSSRPCRWHNEFCHPGISMAVTAVPGVVFAGSLDGWLSAYSTDAGKLLWSFDSDDNFLTTNGTQVDGGTLDAAGPVVANGMLFVHSGYWGRSGPGSVLLAFSIDGK